MFDRFKNRPANPDDPTYRREGNGRTAVADRPVTRGGAATTAGAEETRATAVREPRTAPLTRDHLDTVRARQRAEYGGINWGAAFFGWLVAVGLGAILVGLVAGAGAAVGLTELSGADASGNAETIGFGGAIALLVVLMIAYYAGGYVAGRMSRFDGARQGAGTWLMGLLITIL